MSWTTVSIEPRTWGGDSIKRMKRSKLRIPSGNPLTHSYTGIVPSYEIHNPGNELLDVTVFFELTARQAKGKPTQHTLMAVVNDLTASSEREIVDGIRHAVEASPEYLERLAGDYALPQNPRVLVWTKDK